MKYFGWALFWSGLVLSLGSWSVGADCLRHIYRNQELRYQFLAAFCNSSSIMFAVLAVAGLGLVFLARKEEN